MISAASPGGTCSQTRSTFHPASVNAWSTRRSRSSLPASLRSQYVEFVRGALPCALHPCQKQPSTKTTSDLLLKTMSATTEISFVRSRTFFRKRSPRRWSSDRSRTSGHESVFRFPRITALAAAELALGGGGRLAASICETITTPYDTVQQKILTRPPGPPTSSACRPGRCLAPRPPRPGRPAPLR